MAERDVVRGIMRYLKGIPECFFWKEHGGMYGVAGLPDLICCIQGRFVAFEVKAPAGRLTKLQEVSIGKIRAAGGSAHMVTSVKEVKDILLSLGLEVRNR